mmetsp:Transcript_392/g.1144  ORF Transcript_392/g.1144 Transcript_392/m.1144 type:complete len:210 (-) Transcript_392:547-1176(-)
MPASCPAAMRLILGWTARIQKRSLSRRKVWMQLRFWRSQKRMVLSSELDTMMSWCGWNMTHEMLLRCPRNVSTSQHFVSDMRHSLIMRSSDPLTISGWVGWKHAQFTPLECPSSTYFTVPSGDPNRSALTDAGSCPRTCFTMSWIDGAAPPLDVELSAMLEIRIPGSMFIDDGANSRVRSEEMSHTRTVWSSDAESTRSSAGWKHADMT